MADIQNQPIQGLQLKPMTENDSPHQHKFLVHVVQTGDTLWNIGFKHKVEFDKLVNYNLAFNLDTLGQSNQLYDTEGPDGKKQGLISKIYEARIASRDDEKFSPGKFPPHVNLWPGQEILIPYDPNECKGKIVTEGTVKATCAEHADQADQAYIYAGQGSITDHMSIASNRHKKLNDLLGGLKPELEAVEGDQSQKRQEVEKEKEIERKIQRNREGPVTENMAEQIAANTLVGKLEQDASTMNCEEHGVQEDFHACLGVRDLKFAKAKEMRNKVKELIRSKECNTNKANDKPGKVYYSQDEIGCLVGKGVQFYIKRY